MKSPLILLVILINMTCCQTGDHTADIPFRLERNRTVVDIVVGETEVSNILLDTGMGFDGILIYDPHYLQLIDLSGATQVLVPGAGPDGPSQALLIDSTAVTLGNLVLQNQKIIILKDSTMADFPTNGVIGYSILGHYQTWLDYDSESMSLRDAGSKLEDENWKSLDIYFKGGTIPWLDIEISISGEPSVKIASYIDLASGDAVELLEKPDMKFKLPERSEREYLGTGLSGDIFGSRGIIHSVIIGTYKLQNVPVTISPAPVRSKQDNADIILGNRFLAKFDLVFDYSQAKLYLKPNSKYSLTF